MSHYYLHRPKGLTMKRKLQVILATLLLIGFTGLGVNGAIHNRQEIHRKSIELESKTTQLHQLEIDYKKLNSDLEAENHKKVQDAERIKQLEEEKRQLEERYKALEVSKAEQKAEEQRIASIKLSTPVSAATECGDNFYANYIYMHESSCVLNRVNSIGCYGLGQDCNNVLAASCPNWQTDYACQNSFWNSYMQRRYGSWEAAYNFWLSHKWW